MQQHFYIFVYVHVFEHRTQILNNTLFCPVITIGCECYMATQTLHPYVIVGRLIPKPLLLICGSFRYVERLSTQFYNLATGIFSHSATNPSAHYCLKHIIVYCRIRPVHPKINGTCGAQGAKRNEKLNSNVSFRKS